MEVELGGDGKGCWDEKCSKRGSFGGGEGRRLPRIGQTIDPCHSYSNRWEPSLRHRYISKSFRLTAYKVITENRSKTPEPSQTHPPAHLYPTTASITASALLNLSDQLAGVGVAIRILHRSASRNHVSACFGCSAVAAVPTAGALANPNRGNGGAEPFWDPHSWKRSESASPHSLSLGWASPPAIASPPPLVLFPCPLDPLGPPPADSLASDRCVSSQGCLGRLRTAIRLTRCPCWLVQSVC